MSREKNPGRIDFDGNDFGIPLVAHGGFHKITTPIPLKEHVHAGPELTFLEKGEASWQIDGARTIFLKGGDIALTQENVIHFGKWHIISPCDLFWIVFDFDNLRLFQKENRNSLTSMESESIISSYRNFGNGVCRANANVSATFSKLRSLLLERQNVKNQALEKLGIRLALLDIMLSSAKLFSEGISPSAAHGTDSFIRMVDLYIEAHISTQFSVNDIANSFNISAQSFNEKLKRLTGKSPADYVSRFRCEKARVMLMHSKCNITDIAFRLGFRSSQYFSSVFKKCCGMTPQYFRNGKY